MKPTPMEMPSEEDQKIQPDKDAGLLFNFELQVVGGPALSLTV
jgi:hypothetical protein